MKPPLEKIVKGVGAFCLATQLLLPAPFLPNFQPTALHAQTTKQEQKKKEEKKKVKKEKKPKYISFGEYEKSLKKKKQPIVKPKTSTQDLTGIVNEQSLPKITLRVEHADGREYGTFIVQNTQEKGTFVIDPNNEKHKTLLLPENAIIYLETKSPYKGYRIDMMMDDGTYTKLINPRTGDKIFFRYINTANHNLKTGTKGRLPILLEPKEQIASIVVPYEIIGKPMPELPGPIDLGPVVDWPECDYPEPVPPEKPKPVPKEEPKHIEKKHKPKEPVQPRYSLKALALIGDEGDIPTECEPGKTFGGFMIEGVYYHPNFHAWANYMNVGRDVDEATWGGQVLNRRFSQASLGIDYAVGPLVAEIEGIFSKNEYTPYHGNMFTMPLETSEYKGIFLSGGLRFPFGKKGFASDWFIVGTYGVGFGKQEYKFTDNIWYDFTYDSEAITEKDCIKVHLKTPFLEATYSQSDYDNALKNLHGKRNSLGVKGKLPLKAISKSLNGFYLIGFYFDGKDNNALLRKELKPKIFGVGIGYEK